jgi:ATP-dependent RNA helicase DeaD
MQKIQYSTEQILQQLNISQLNAMQQAAVAAIALNNDVVLLSATGTGKTLAFLLPIVPLLYDSRNRTLAMIVVPTRELALQIEDVFKSMGTGIKITACYGGHARLTEENNLTEPPAVVVGTPGRLCDHISRGNIKTEHIATLILDEFDKTMELGFEEEMKYIVASLPPLKNRVLTSATRAAAIPDFIGLQQPILLDYLTEAATTEDKLLLRVVLSDQKDKTDTLFRLVCYTEGKAAIVFCNHRESVERVSRYLADEGIVNAFYHGGMEQQHREAALCKFRNGSVAVLVTTDLGARGLDISGVMFIVHYHLPLTQESYIHRNGRTARMNATGTAVLLLSQDETLPEYLPSDTEVLTLPEHLQLPEPPAWTTLFVAAGKKDKINKTDIVGFLAQQGGLKKEEIGLIEVKDFFSFAAIRRDKLKTVLAAIKNEKIKNKRILIAPAK